MEPTKKAEGFEERGSDEATGEGIEGDVAGGGGVHHAGEARKTTKPRSRKSPLSPEKD